jgi:hypothetical protein
MAYYERNLPHWLPEGKNLFVTWRLHGSLPVVVLEALRKSKDLGEGKKFLLFDRELDGAGFGPVWLRQPRIANIVKTAIDEVARAGLCTVHAYVVMPNHVHLLLEPKVELKQLRERSKAVQPEPATRCLIGRACAFGRRNRSIIGCGIQHHLKGFGHISKETQSPRDWSKCQKSGNGRVPLGSTGFSLWLVPGATERLTMEEQERHRLKPVLQESHG